VFDWLFRKEEKEEWCCPLFRELYEYRHERTLFVFARPPGWAGCTAFTFWLAFRCVRSADHQRIPWQQFPPDLPITISTSQRILYCPYCGAHLEQSYGDRGALLVDSAIVKELTY
jgi:hypothetical protein